MYLNVFLQKDISTTYFLNSYFQHKYIDIQYMYDSRVMMTVIATVMRMAAMTIIITTMTAIMTVTRRTRTMTTTTTIISMITATVMVVMSQCRKMCACLRLYVLRRIYKNMCVKQQCKIAERCAGKCVCICIRVCACVLLYVM